MANRSFGRSLRFVAAAWAATVFFGAGLRLLADCSSFGLPFTDLDETGFCAEIAEAYYTGITNGTLPTTFSPTASVTREQAAAFATRTLDAALARGSRRAALGQWWTSTPHFDQGLALTSVSPGPVAIQSDGADLWVASVNSSSVSRVRASDGKLLDSWTGAAEAFGVLVAMGRVFVVGQTSPGGLLFMIDPTQPGGALTAIVSTLGHHPSGIAFDGNKIWTANTGDFLGDGNGSVSIVTPGTWNVTTVKSGFSQPKGIIFDGMSIWVTDIGDGRLKRLDSSGAILQSVSTGGGGPYIPVFDGHNIWVPDYFGNSLTVVRASDGAVLKTFSAASGEGNGLNAPVASAFDGRRILVTNQHGGLSLFNSTDLSPIGFFPAAGVSVPSGACSDGVNFWVAFSGSGKIGRL